MLKKNIKKYNSNSVGVGIALLDIILLPRSWLTHVSPFSGPVCFSLTGGKFFFRLR